jgi:hypothetical protein
MVLMLFLRLALRPLLGTGASDWTTPVYGVLGPAPYKISLTTNFFRWTFADG